MQSRTTRTLWICKQSFSQFQPKNAISFIEILNCIADLSLFHNSSFSLCVQKRFARRSLSSPTWTSRGDNRFSDTCSCPRARMWSSKDIENCESGSQQFGSHHPKWSKRSNLERWGQIGHLFELEAH
jgi:hypothetical protein